MSFICSQPKDILKTLDENDKEIDSLISPDGTKKFPAKTCYDLFLDHKNFKNGKFIQIQYVVLHVSPFVLTHGLLPNKKGCIKWRQR